MYYHEDNDDINGKDKTILAVCDGQSKPLAKLFLPLLLLEHLMGVAMYIQQAQVVMMMIIMPSSLELRKMKNEPS